MGALLCLLAVVSSASGFNTSLGNKSPRYLLTVVVVGNGHVSSRPAGILCPPTCSHRFVKGTTVVLTAREGPTSRFVGWKNGCSTYRVCASTLHAQRTLVAVFKKRATPSPPQPTPPPPPTPTPPPPPTPPPTGHYTGTTSQNEAFNFDVAGFSLTNLRTGQVNESCDPPFYIYGNYTTVGQAAINPDLSFRVEWSAPGSVGSAAARFHKVIEGHFNGAIAAGNLKIDTTFIWTDGTYYTCSSGPVSWTATLTT
jgi:hypothetical protein